MRVLSIHPVSPQQRLVDQVLDYLRQGGIMAYPTDTCYGLGCSIHEKKAIDQLYRLKRQDTRKPMSFICSDLKHIADYAHVSNRAYKLMRKLLPGPYTFVLPATRLVPKLLQNKRKQVGIRVPKHAVTLEIVRQLGHPIISTTCQVVGDEAPCMDVQEIRDRFDQHVELVIDGDFIYPEYSTVVSIDDDNLEILREGKGDVAPFEI